jgi:hypothetical protein
MKRIEFLLPIILLAGCASTRVISQNTITDMGGIEEIQKYQFYVSANLTLQDAEPFREQENYQMFGTAAVKDRVVINKIKIGKRSMGALMHAYTDSDNMLVLEVCFEADDDLKRLRFRQDGPGLDRRFYLTYTEPQKRILGYGDSSYIASYSGSERPYLIMKFYKSRKETVRTRTVKGRRIKP